MARPGRARRWVVVGIALVVGGAILSVVRSRRIASHEAALGLASPTAGGTQR